MNPEDTVSVIIPVHDDSATPRAESLCAAVASALNQTLPPLEIIVVDDDSEMPIADLLRQRFHDECIRCLRQPRGGPARARNRGIAVARGEYVAFLDSDDLWLPTKLDKQIAALRANPAALMAICHAEARDAQGKVQARYEGYSRMPRMWRLLRALLPTVVIRRKDLGSGFDEDFEYAEDRDLFIRLGMRGDLAIVPEMLVQARRLDRSMMSALSGDVARLQRYERDILRLYRKARRYPGVTAADRAHLQYRTAISLHDIGAYALRLRHRQLARRALWRAFRLHPLRPATWPLLLRSLC